MKAFASSPVLSLQITPVPFGWQWKYTRARDSPLSSCDWDASLAQNTRKNGNTHSEAEGENQTRNKLGTQSKQVKIVSITSKAVEKEKRTGETLSLWRRGTSWHIRGFPANTEVCMILESQRVTLQRLRTVADHDVHTISLGFSHFYWRLSFLLTSVNLPSPVCSDAGPGFLPS